MLSGIARVTPSLPQRGRQPKGASPLDPEYRSFFMETKIRPCSTGRGSTDPERPWPITIQYYPSQVFYRANFSALDKFTCTDKFHTRAMKTS